MIYQHDMKSANMIAVRQRWPDVQQRRRQAIQRRISWLLVTPAITPTVVLPTDREFVI